MIETIENREYVFKYTYIYICTYLRVVRRMKTRKEKERKRREREEKEKTRAESRLRPPPCGWNQLHGDQCQYNVHDHAPVWFAFESRWTGTSAGFLSRGLTKKGGAIIFPFLLSRPTSIHPCLFLSLSCLFL